MILLIIQASSAYLEMHKHTLRNIQKLSHRPCFSWRITYLQKISKRLVHSFWRYLWSMTPSNLISWQPCLTKHIQKKILVSSFLFQILLIKESWNLIDWQQCLISQKKESWSLTFLDVYLHPKSKQFNHWFRIYYWSKNTAAWLTMSYPYQTHPQWGPQFLFFLQFPYLCKIFN